MKAIGKIRFATILSLAAPGLGHLVSGYFGWAILWLIVTPGFWLGSGGLAGLICHLICAYQTHTQVK